MGPAFFSIGMILSFTVFGFIVARVGYKIGFDTELISSFSSLLLIILGASYIFRNSKFMNSFQFLNRVSNVFVKFQNLKPKNMLLNEFYLGVLIGGIRSPCTGPSLGVAITYATKEGEAFFSFLMMLAYGIGSTLPLLLIAYLFQNTFKSKILNLTKTIEKSKTVFGYIILVSGLLIFSGLDKYLEFLILKNLPDAFLNLITKY